LLKVADFRKEDPKVIEAIQNVQEEMKILKEKAIKGEKTPVERQNQVEAAIQ
jgi:hypothetical protein